MNVTASFNKKYVDYAIVMFASFCESNPEHNDLFIMHSELEDSDIERIRWALSKYDASITVINVSNEVNDPKMPVSDFWSVEIYYRLLLADKLPDYVDRILYLDVDIIVHGSVKELYYSDFEGADLMAALDSNNRTTLYNHDDKVIEMLLPLYGEEFPYFNSGVLLMNIEQMRGKYTFDLYLNAMKEWDYKMAAPDQDILNYVHHGKVKYIEWEKWDLFAKLAYGDGWTYEDVLSKNIITHFAGNKPWNFDNVHFEFEKLWWDYAEKTVIYKELLEGFLENALTNNRLEKEAIRLHNENKEFAKAIDEAMQILSRFGAE